MQRAGAGYSLLILAVLVASACAPAGSSGTAELRATATASPSPTPTAIPKIYLSQLEPGEVQVGFATLGVGLYPLSGDDMHVGTPIKVQGREYPHGLFAHAPSTLQYDLHGSFTTFGATVMLEDYPRGLCGGDGAVFEVFVDGERVFRSSIASWESLPEQVEVDVTGAEELRLVVDSRQNISCDYAIWGDPYLIPTEGYIPPPAAESRTAIYPTAVPAGLPCSDPAVEQDFLFLDCADIRRIRGALESSDPALLAAWNANKDFVDGYRQDLPTAYDPNDSSGVLWWGQGNYIAQDIALMYLVTGDRAYATDSRYLLELVRKSTPYRAHFVHRRGGFAGGLIDHPRHSNMPFSSLLFSYFAIRDTELFTPEERQTFDDFFVHQGYLALEAIAPFGGRIPLDSDENRNLPHAAAIIAATMATAFPEHPLSQDLFSRAWPELEWQIRTWWHPDGGSGEDVERYGYVRMAGLLLLAETMQRYGGGDLYAMDFGGKSLQTLCRHYLRIVTPEGISPMLNDSPIFWIDPGYLRLCAFRYQDGELAYAADFYRWGVEHALGHNDLGQQTRAGEIMWWGLPPEPTRPAFTSLASPQGGFGILRSDWSHSASYLLLQFTRSKVHGDRSFGAVYLFDGGPWMIGNGYSPEEVDRTPTWQHSTMGMDGVSQTEFGGTLVTFADLGELGVISAEANPYPGRAHRRTVAWMKPWHQWLVWDDVGLYDGKPHSLQLRWYVRGTTETGRENVWTFLQRSPGRAPSMQIAMYPGQEATYREIGRHYATWEEPYTAATGVELDTVVRADRARLVSSLTTVAAVPGVSRTDVAQGTILASTLGATTWEWLIPSTPRTSDLDAGVVAGLAGCARLRVGRLEAYCLIEGTAFTRASQDLLRADVPVSVEVDFAESKVIVDTSAPTEIVFYWPSPVAAITVGEDLLEFSQDGTAIRVTLPAGRTQLDLGSSN